MYRVMFHWNNNCKRDEQMSMCSQAVMSIGASAHEQLWADAQLLIA